MPFELQVSVLGEPAIQDCRVVFAATLMDHDRERRRVIGRLTMYYEMLEWRDLADGGRLPVPTWTRVGPDGVLPLRAERRLEGLIEEAAIRIEQLAHLGE